MQIVSNGLLPSDKPIDVICRFNADGTMEPLRIRMQVDDDKIQYEVLESDIILAHSPAAIVFKCAVISNNIKQTLNIMFMRHDCRWIYRP